MKKVLEGLLKFLKWVLWFFIFVVFFISFGKEEIFGINTVPLSMVLAGLVVVVKDKLSKPENKEENKKLKDLKLQQEVEIKKIEELKSQQAEEIRKLKDLNKDIEKMESKLKIVEKEYEGVEEQVICVEHGLTEPKYEFANSSICGEKLKEIRAKQKEMVKNKTAVFHTNWVVNNSKKEGKRMTDDMIKLVLRAFNFECDNIISNVKHSNFTSQLNKLEKSFESINKLGKNTKVTITPDYYNLKTEEFFLASKYANLKEEEREEQKRIKERMREEAEEERKLKEEIEKEVKKLEKEETHFTIELEKLNHKLSVSDDKNEQLLAEIEALKQQIVETKVKKQDIENIKERTRAGYVYVISNIGSFGEDVYKIGMTRRLVPEDRVKELGDASVPFKFDIHAMIFSEDAPKLESEIHKLLNDKRVNKVNYRKEFFRVTLEEIENIVCDKLGKKIDFTIKAEAKEYYESLLIK